MPDDEDKRARNGQSEEFSEEESHNPVTNTTYVNQSNDFEVEKQAEEYMETPPHSPDLPNEKDMIAKANGALEGGPDALSGDPNAKEPDNKGEGKVEGHFIENEMKQAYLSYAMSVIVGRALPDVRDGLKPVHRRILYAMHEMGMFHNKPFKKSARIVGEVLGKYHPHGDSAVYEAMVRMAQHFSLRYPLVQGQGNFGSVDGDSAAAMRYTEARLSKVVEEMLEDIKKDTIKFVPNFDASLKEPSVLPSKIPNLLLNGSSGIAVGMATNIPPHNMNEICDGVIEVIDNPDVTTDKLLGIVRGPDFPTAGIVTNVSGIRKAYETGRGAIRVKARAEIEDYKNRQRIIINEIPYTVNKAMLIEEIARLVKNKKVEGISDLRDESDREGIRIVIELKREVAADVVLNQLYKHSRMQVTFGINMLAIVNNEPKTLSLKEIMQHFVEHRFTVVTKRTEFDLRKAQEKGHILEGLIIALDDIDNVIQKIKESKDTATAQEMLMTDYPLSEAQSKAILEMRLSRLASLEQEKIRMDYKETMTTIDELQSILADKGRIYCIIKDELKDMKEKYGDRRKTEISEFEDEDIDIEDLIEKEDMVVTISHHGYIKRTSINEYREQRRGGKGILASGTKDEDFLEHMFVANTHSHLMVFTSKGRVHWLKVYQLPEGTRQAKGKAIVNLIYLDQDERVQTFIPITSYDDKHFLMLVTRNGIVKKTNLMDFSRPRKGGIIAINIEEGDQLVNVKLTNGDNHILISTEQGMAVRFRETDVRAMGRTARGVKGIKLRQGDKVVDAVVAYDNQSLLTVTQKGYGKRSAISEYRLIGRGGVGVKNIIVDDRNGKVVASMDVTDEDSVMLISKKGIIIRTSCKYISVIGRGTKGVRVMRIGDDDEVVACARVLNGDDEADKE